MSSSDDAFLENAATQLAAAVGVSREMLFVNEWSSVAGGVALRMTVLEPAAAVSLQSRISAGSLAIFYHSATLQAEPFSLAAEGSMSNSQKAAIGAGVVFGVAVVALVAAAAILTRRPRPSRESQPLL